ncbi:DUF1045 domain-containing protein [Sulfitobacter sp. S190]|uniref:DUF1045 domain-containing protein n=1 Tax=Sulfitobacter sp. S190 TaxID=2867022 RepID=UPI0021A2E8DB|nr:DUF1045 domain-containing protein [Sulfitobacter sp. S190]
MFERYAVYFTPQGGLAEKGAAWLGWDIARGRSSLHPVLAGVDLAEVTRVPRKYGFHATIKPPFHLAQGQTAQALAADLEKLAGDLAAVTLTTLSVSRLGRFVALKPVGDTAALADLAARVVTGLDTYRAPASKSELARRRKRKLSVAQERYLTAWGYPYVMDEFRFHMTLTSPVEDAARIVPLAVSFFRDVLPTPFCLDALTLVGQDADGMFHEIDRFALTGK